MVMMYKPSMLDALSGGTPEQAPRWDLVDTESCGSGIRILAPYLIVWGYVCIYRREEYIGGCLWGPGERGAPRRGERALLSPGRLDYFLTCTPSPLDHVRSKNHVPEGFILFDILFPRNSEIGKMAILGRASG